MLSEIQKILNDELKRQREHIELIASENFVSKDVLIAAGSILTNKYAEGYPGKRYYRGNHEIDKIEKLAQNLAKELFNVNFVNVQPHSGSQANQAVFLAFLQPGDKILSMSLDCGGHLTHGSKKNMSGMWFDVIHYSVDRDTYLIDYNEIEKLALEHKPKLILAGFSSYSRIIDWQKFKKIADKVNAVLIADIAHVAGLIATNNYPSPVGYADVITTTTHKTLRGPRGGMIMTNNEEYAKKIDSALFPGLQGGPLMHIIAAKAVCFNEALQPSFKEYGKNILKNAKTLSETLIKNNVNVLTNGTDNHIVIVDLKNKNLTGFEVEKHLENINIICNRNMIPFDPLPPMKTSGIRLGTPACTTRGFTTEDFVEIGETIANLINMLSVKNIISENEANEMKNKMLKIALKYDIYQDVKY